MEYTHSFQNKTLFFRCGGTQRDTAEFFSSLLEREDGAHHILRNGYTLQIGWGFYRILETGGQYQILACDISSDPFQDFTGDLSLSLEIFAAQRMALSAAKVTPVETSFQDTMIVQRTAVKASRVYLQRSKPGEPPDSGWYMGAVEERAPKDPAAYARIYTYQLLGFCREALSVIQFPLGTLCVFEGGRLVEAVDRNHKVLLEGPAG